MMEKVSSWEWLRVKDAKRKEKLRKIAEPYMKNKKRG
jgi:hypothetical protein